MSIRHRAILTAGLCLFASGADAACLVDQVQDQWNSTSGGFRWQSFTAGESGLLCRVDVNTANALDDATLAIYAGEGLAGAVLHTQSVDLGADVSQIPIDAPVELASGETYTIHFEEITAWRLQTGDPYGGGVGNINPDVDFWFRTHVDAVSVPATARSWGRIKARYRSE